MPRFLTMAMLEEGEEDEDEEGGDGSETTDDDNEAEAIEHQLKAVVRGASNPPPPAGPALAKAGTAARRGSFAFWMMASGGGASVTAPSSRGTDGRGSTSSRRSTSGSGAMVLGGARGGGVRKPRAPACGGREGAGGHGPHRNSVTATTVAAPTKLPTPALTVSAPNMHVDLSLFGIIDADSKKPTKMSQRSVSLSDHQGDSESTAAGISVSEASGRGGDRELPGLRVDARSTSEHVNPAVGGGASRTEPNLRLTEFEDCCELSALNMMPFDKDASPPGSRDAAMVVQAMAEEPHGGMEGGVLMKAVAVMRHPDDSTHLAALGGGEAGQGLLSVQGTRWGGTSNASCASSAASDSERLRLAYIQRYRCGRVLRVH